MILRLRSAVALLTCWSFVSTVSAASTNLSIGLAMTNGDVQVDGVPAPGNAAIFSGSRIASGSGISNLKFSDGTSALLRPSSQMTVYAERSVLLKGVAMQRGAEKHPVIADGLRISGATPEANVLVEVKDDSHFQVAAEGGELDVRSSTGNLIARVEPGKNLSFTISQAPTGIPENSVNLCGRVRDNDQLTDTFTSVTYQLQGTGLGTFHGRTVMVTGTLVNPSAAPQAVTVSTIRTVHSCEVGRGAVPAATIGSGLGLILIALAFGGLGAGIYFAVTAPSTTIPVTPAVP
jgi:hypothetical protein